METECYHWWNHQWYEHHIIDSCHSHMLSNVYSDSHGGWFSGLLVVIEHDAVRRSNVDLQLAVLFHYAYYLHACSQLVS